MGKGIEVLTAAKPVCKVLYDQKGQQYPGGQYEEEAGY